jgi:hypothetical protein
MMVQTGGQSSEDPKPSRHLQPAPREMRAAVAGGGSGSRDAGKVVDALRASAEQEFAIAERLAGKARQAFALGAGVFIVAQTVAFGNFEATKLSSREQHWIIALAILAVLVLGVAALATIKADAPAASRDLPLEKLEADLNAAYEGDPNVIGRLGEYYLGVVRSRRHANKNRRFWYALARGLVSASLVATTVELIFALIARAT